MLKTIKFSGSSLLQKFNYKLNFSTFYIEIFNIEERISLALELSFSSFMTDSSLLIIEEVFEINRNILG